MFNWKTYKRQHVQAVDMCAAAIFSHRMQGIALKAIYLWPDMYKQFLAWAEKNAGRELHENERLEFDGIGIEIGEKRQATPLLLELWAEGAEA